MIKTIRHLLIASALALFSINVTASVKGKYELQRDKSFYFVFDGKSKYTFYKRRSNKAGTYKVENNTIIITMENGTPKKHPYNAKNNTFFITERGTKLIFKKSSSANISYVDEKQKKISTLIKRLKSGNINAAMALQNFKSVRVVDALIEALKEGKGSVRVASAMSLSIIQDPKAIDSLVYVLQNDKDQSLRVIAALALGRIKHPKSVEALIPALKIKNIYIRTTVVKAIGEQDNSKTVKPLRVALKNEEKLMKNATDDSKKGEHKALIAKINKILSKIGAK
ncbi:hypothetical protein MNBD_GAMMA12-3942 [hydrothermal vent metagenome]|uniref:HEAT repeat domain-containing protein n=1 Tax=hydrothermal vent metagenome TaxID=652676 RepID=A0A3B0YX19_9ZZZZ